ncbi:MAG: hypothetical protein VXZ78_05900, partial [Pseudomonadota bacterium]|nr:hypothetical protein [Pseudomonadota bacterium]
LIASLRNFSFLYLYHLSIYGKVYPPSAAQLVDANDAGWPTVRLWSGNPPCLQCCQTDGRESINF